MQKIKIISVVYHRLNLQYSYTQEKSAADIETLRSTAISCECVYQLANAFLATCKDFDYEIWQPDITLNDNRIYRFENGLTYRLFPATVRKYFYGVKTMKEVFSRQLIEELHAAGKNQPLILHLHSEFTSINREIIKDFIKIAIVYSFHGSNTLPSGSFLIPTKNILSKINLLIGHLWLRKYLNKVWYITYQTDNDFCQLKKIYKGESEKLTMGCDFSYFYKLDKEKCRIELKLPRDKFIMVSVAVFRDIKQIDRFIKVLTRLIDKYSFDYIVAGYGEEKYENYLKNVAMPLLNRGMIKFTGYLEAEAVLKYLNSADLFITTSLSEGGPISTMEAFACELPVFSTRTGNAAELMEKENAGCLVGTKNYKEWEEKLARILKTKQLPKVLKRDIVKEHYDWQNIAQKFVNIYKGLNQN